MTGNPSRYFSAGDIALLAPRAAFPWTICVLFYGDYPELCRRFLDCLYRFTDPAAFHFRAGMNAVGRETLRLLKAATREHGNISLYPSRRNFYKCPMMRRLFHEPVPRTEWTIWFDDDSRVTGPGWILDLALAMERVKEAELFGSLRRVEVSDHLEKFISSARWYRGLHRQIDPGSGRRTILFPVGGFWAVRTARIVQTGWPDSRLIHFEDDYLMGEAMRQHGVNMVHFESGVCISDAPRRAPLETPRELSRDYGPS